MDCYHRIGNYLLRISLLCALCVLEDTSIAEQCWLMGVSPSYIVTFKHLLQTKSLHSTIQSSLLTDIKPLASQGLFVAKFSPPVSVKTLSEKETSQPQNCYSSGEIQAQMQVIKNNDPNVDKIGPHIQLQIATPVFQAACIIISLGVLKFNIFRGLSFKASSIA